MQAASYRGRQPSAIIAHFFGRPSAGSRASLRDRGALLCGGQARGTGTTPLTSSGELPIFGEIRLFAGAFSDPTFFSPRETDKTMETDCRGLSASQDGLGNLWLLEDLRVSVRATAQTLAGSVGTALDKGENSPRQIRLRRGHYRVSRQSTAQRPPRDNGDGPRFVPSRSGKCTWI